MHLDFPAIMVLAVFITGGIWLVDSLLWLPKRKQRAQILASKDKNMLGTKLEEEQEKVLKEPILVEYSRSLFPVIFIVLILRSFMVEPFRIPSGSMMPTLLVGDFILVNKYAYGIRLPVLNTKIIEVGAPKRGDVAVFRYPKDPSTDYIKRVIGLPGDNIKYIDKQVYINGELMNQVENSVYDGTGAGVSMSGALVKSENLGEVEHKVLINRSRPIVNEEFVVPPDHYFVMGDNRDNSNDSRYWGTVPQDNLVGRAFLIWMNWDSAKPTFSKIAWDRVGSTIK